MTENRKKLTAADRQAREDLRTSAERLHDLAEKALADLERKAGGPVRPPGLSNAEWLRQMAEEAQEKLDRQASS